MQFLASSSEKLPPVTITQTVMSPIASYCGCTGNMSDVIVAVFVADMPFGKIVTIVI